MLRKIKSGQILQGVDIDEFYQVMQDLKIKKSKERLLDLNRDFKFELENLMKIDKIQEVLNASKTNEYLLSFGVKKRIITIPKKVQFSKANTTVMTTT